MNDYFIVMTVSIFALGAYLTYLLNKIKDLEEQVDSYYEVVVSMARELKSYGSKNVDIVEAEEDE